MRLLFITYKVADRDSLVGFVAGWLRDLSVHFERIEVLCLAAGQADLPANIRVHSLGKEAGVGRLARGLGFFRALWGLRDSVDAVFCQFSPEYVIAAAPLARLRGWPITLWYTHRQVTLRLRLAVALADRVVTASPESFQLATPKLRVIGHGIDTGRFCPVEGLAPAGPPVLLAVGRRAPIKRYELLIDAVELLTRAGRQLRVRIVGGDEGNAPPGYAAGLQTRIDRAGLHDIVQLVGPLPYDQVPGEYQRAVLHVNLAPTGGMDKAVLEGLAAGTPSLACNETFRPLFGEDADLLILPEDTAGTLAAHIAALLDKPETERRALGLRLRERVTAGYGQAAQAARLADAIKGSR